MQEITKEKPAEYPIVENSIDFNKYTLNIIIN